MFLSKVILQPRSGATHRLLTDIYAQHRFVLSAFPEGGTPREVLYRVETAEQGRKVFLLAQSAEAPDWERVCDLYPQIVQCAHPPKEVQPAVEPGRRFRFRLRANPTKMYVNRGDKGKPDPTRAGLYREEEQRDWFVRAAARGGFVWEEAALLITPLPLLRGVKPAPPEGGREHRLQCFAVDFDGTLTVRDAEAFSQSLRGGVGRGKAWGCGLLSLAPLG